MLEVLEDVHCKTLLLQCKAEFWLKRFQQVLLKEEKKKKQEWRWGMQHQAGYCLSKRSNKFIEKNSKASKGIDKVQEL